MSGSQHSLFPRVPLKVGSRHFTNQEKRQLRHIQCLLSRGQEEEVKNLIDGTRLHFNHVSYETSNYREAKSIRKIFEDMIIRSDLCSN